MIGSLLASLTAVTPLQAAILRARERAGSVKKGGPILAKMEKEINEHKLEIELLKASQEELKVPPPPPPPAARTCDITPLCAAPRGLEMHIRVSKV